MRNSLFVLVCTRPTFSFNRSSSEDPHFLFIDHLAVEKDKCELTELIKIGFHELTVLNVGL
jgi:hypothetical protein